MVEGVERLLANPLFQLALAWLGYVIGVKVTPNNSNAVLVVAWLIAFVPVYRALPGDNAVRFLLTMVAMGASGLALYFSPLWTRQPSVTAVRPTAPTAVDNPAPKVRLMPTERFILRDVQDTVKGDGTLATELGAPSVGVMRSTRLILTNDGPSTAYSVWVRVWTETSGVRAEDLVIRGAVDPAAPQLSTDPRLNWSLDGFGYSGIDALGYEAVLFHLYRLVPGAIRTFDVSSTTKIDNSTAQANVIAFALSPQAFPAQLDVRSGPNEAWFGVDINDPGNFKQKRGMWSLQAGHIVPPAQVP